MSTAGGQGHDDAGPTVTDLDAVVDARDVQMAFQPMVDLTTGELVGYEALARGPVGPLNSPAVLFDLAARSGRVAELDWVCRAAAFDAFREADAPPGMSLFVNVEMASLTRGCPADLLARVSHAESTLRVFVEVNDRTLADDPASLLETVDRAREMGWGISVDDIGTSLGCLSVLPLVHADVVKLDVRMLDDEHDIATCEVVAAVLRHIEATGAALVVKGIESDADERLALALGARYGQGHHLGVPGPLERGDPMPRAVVPLLGRGRGVCEGRSPFEILASLDRRRVSQELLRRLAQIFTLRALRAGSRPVVLLGPGNRTPGDLGRLDADELERLAELSVLVVVFGVGMPAEPVPGVRGVDLCARDPLVGERFMAVLTDTFSFAMSARRGAGGLLELVTTQEPNRVGDVAQYLLRRTPSAGEPNQAQPVPVPDVAQTQEPTDVEDGADDTVTAGPLMRRWRAKVRR